MTAVFPTPMAPISWGELIDKITILEIKQIKIRLILSVHNKLFTSFFTIKKDNETYE